MTPLLFKLGFATCCSTLIGGTLLLLNPKKQHYFFAFAAGALISISFLDLMPEALEIGQNLHISFRLLLECLVSSFFLYSFIDRFFLTHHLHEETDNHQHPFGIIGGASLIIHSMFDGAAIALAFQVNHTVGVIVALAVLLHDTIDGTNTVVVLLKNGHSKLKAIIFLILDALAPLLGIFITSLFLFPEKYLAFILTFFCGEFLYIGAASLLPETKKQPSWIITTCFASGLLYIAVLTSIFN